MFRFLVIFIWLLLLALLVPLLADGRHMWTIGDYVALYVLGVFVGLVWEVRARALDAIFARRAKRTRRDAELKKPAE